MMLLRPYILLFLLCFALAPVHAVAADAVRGSFLIGAGQYRAEVDGKEVQKVSSQYNQAALRYDNQGVIGSDRFGKYKLMLGYEFNVLSPTISDYGVRDPAVERIEEGKVLYLGEMILAPGGLPFRLSAYSRDIHSTSFLNTGSRSPMLPIGLQAPREYQSETTLLTPQVVTDINDGTHHQIGATLLVGIRNGSYLGNYRDILSRLPRLLIDYKQTEVRDLARDSEQQNYRERDLAFISLNKKDNWVHFRTRDYKDFLDNAKDFQMRQVMIGTVDHVMSRQWINLTNWIKISGDLSYTSEKWKGVLFAENTYRVNLFATTQQQGFSSSVLSSFSRSSKGESVTQELDLPIYFSYAPDRDSYYRGSLRSHFEKRSHYEGLSFASQQGDFDTDDITFDWASELFRTRAVLFKPRLNLSVRERDEISRDSSEKLTLEWSSPPGKKNLLPWTAGYYIMSTQTSSETNSTLYLEQSLYGSVEKDLGRAMRGGLRGSVRHGQGQSDITTDPAASRVEISGSGSGFNKDDIDRFLHYSGLLFWEHAAPRLSNRLELTGEGIMTDSDNLTLTEARHLLKMARPLDRFSLTSTLSRGSLKEQVFDMDYLQEVANTAGQADLGWSSKAEYRYEPERFLRLTVAGSAKGTSTEEGRSSTWLGSEKLEYLFYKRTGVIRKYAELSEEIGFERSSARDSDRRQSHFLRLAAALFPTKHFYAKVASEFLLFNPGSSEQMTLNAETGANFEKLQVVLTYGRGYKAAEGLLAEVREERWDMKVKKRF